MKLILLVSSLLIFATGLVSGQTVKNAALEQEIRKLDLAHANAILRKDIEALKVLIADDAVTNHPTNKIVKEREGILELIRNGTINYASFVRVPEEFLFFKGMVVVMGHETLTMAPSPDKQINRRYTNVWMKRKGKWQLTVRHAHVFCPN